MKKVLLIIGFFCFAGGAQAATGELDLGYAIDSLAGKVEIRRAGQTKWESLRREIRVNNNDMIRVYDRSALKLLSKDGSKLYIRQNTQLQVVVAGRQSEGFISRHTTIFFGAVFFVVRNTLPQSEIKRYDVKVFTPTAVVAVRGTSFAVEVDKESGATLARVVHGSLLLRNSIQNTSTYLSAPYQARVELKTVNAPCEPMTLGHVDTLKSWVPESEIGSELVAQVQKARRDRRIITGKGERTLVVVPFVNVSSYGGGWELGRVMATELAAGLSGLYPEMDAIVSGAQGSNALETAKKEQARFVVTGEIEVFDVVQYARVSVQADDYKEYNVGRVKVSLRLIDIAQEKVLYDGVVTGEVSGRNEPVNTWQHIGKQAFVLGKGEFVQTILGQATRQALDQSNDVLQKYIQF